VAFPPSLSWRTTTPDPQASRRPDLVGRDFTASDLDRLWVGDQSYLRCWEGVVYFAFIVDAFSRRIVGWQLASHMRTDLVLDALKMALRCQNKLTGQQQETYKPSLRGTRSSSLLSPADCGSLLHAVRGR
jgi:transposase InsO family protein